MARQIVVIGGGPAAVEAAKAAATAGANVTVVSDSPIGGRSGWDSLLPSKVWLTAADTLGVSAESAPLGVTMGASQPNPSQILARIQAVEKSWNGQLEAELKALGVDIITGVGAFASGCEVVVKNSGGEEIARLQPKATIIAGGSVPVFPEKLRPDGKRVLAPRFARDLNWLPARAVVIGAGATGTEFVYMFNRLGIAVTWVVDQFGILPAFDRAAGEFIDQVLTHRGVTILRDQLAERIDRAEDSVTVVTSVGETISADMVFVAIGRIPDLSRLNLEAAGLAAAKGQSLAVDGYGQTSVPGIYVVGDAAGAPMLANRAMAQAWVAGQHAAGANAAPFRPETVIHAIYSEPQVAQVGSLAGRRSRVSYSDTLKAHLLPDGDGFVELAVDSHRKISGGLAVGAHAADQLAPVALAIQTGATVDDLAAVFAAHPTLSELVFRAARQA